MYATNIYVTYFCTGLAICEFLRVAEQERELLELQNRWWMGQQYSKSTRHKFSNYMYEYFIGHRQTGHKPGRRRRRRIKRLHNGTAFVNAGSATCPTAPISQPGGDSREPPPSMAGSPTPAAQQAGIGDNQGTHSSVSVNLIELGSPETTPPPESGEIQGLMANLDIS